MTGLFLNDRLNYFCSKWSQPKCPNCQDTMQQQIKQWLRAPAEWKCRLCKTSYTYEPVGVPKP